MLLPELTRSANGFFAARPPVTAACPRVLDLSRTVASAGRTGASSIDRVEQAYWSWLSARRLPAWAIVRIGSWYALLDQAGAQQMQAALDKAVLPEPLQPRSRWAARRRIYRLRALVARHATAHGSRARLLSVLSARFPDGFEYINVGHSNLDGSFLSALRGAGAAAIRIKLHDTIPLDHPQFVRLETPARFAGRLRAALFHADQIICNSAYTASRVLAHAPGSFDRRRLTIAHLGVSLPRLAPARAALHPYFISVGTIEPRKNHAFLFRLWERMVKSGGPKEAPHLVIAGTRGWRNNHVFDLLDKSPLMDRYIHEMPDLRDDRLYSLMAGSCGLLFPSFEEGFCLPGLEARALGVDVVCPPLPVFRELLTDHAQFVELADFDGWIDAITALAGKGTRDPAASTVLQADSGIPTWDQHFNSVFG